MKGGKKKTRKSRGKWSMRVFDSMKKADDADREYWWSRTPGGTDEGVGTVAATELGIWPG